MKINLTLLAILMLFSINFAKAQKQPELYFCFPLQDRDAIHSITRQISIDDYRNDTVWAYASMSEFVKFSQEGYNITVLPSPGYAPDVVMKDNIILTPMTTWNYYPTYTAYEGLMTGFQTSYPAICQVSTFATLASGRKLMVAKISDNVAANESEPEVFLTSSMHGDETTGYILMLHLIDYLLSNYGTNSEVTDLVNNLEIYINPLANPDGTYAGGNTTVNGATRYNGNSIDLNRNYPDFQAGQHPDGNAWQPETIAFMDFATQHHFIESVNFHGGAEVVNYPWDTWATLHADDIWWQYISREYADTVHLHAVNNYMTYLNNGVTNGYAWYQVTGGRQDYMNYYQHCREFTIELSDTKLLPASELEAHWTYNWRSLILFMKEARYGIHGIITDQSTGNPVAAKVFITGHDVDASEVYSSSTPGDYHRPIKAGTYTLQVSASNYQTQTISGLVVSDNATTTLNIQLLPNMVTTTTITGITMTTATSGGTVVSDGGSPITARGVCWATTANPVSTGNHTTDGTGTGTFTSSITGLSSSTLYHVRAYATNANGTYYGDDLTFTTTCGTITAFPWNEDFENAGTIPSCWSQEYVTTPNLSWTFITGSGNSHPAAAHGGTYNACLKDATAADDKTKLVSPPINLLGVSSPTLTFWHTQAAWSGDQDQLIVYYRTSSTGTWTAIGTYTASVTAWTQRTVSLPNGSSDYYIAFEGNAKYGYGVCVDDVSISGTTSPTLAVTPANQNVTAASGATAYTVTSNSAWTASSSQAWCTVNTSGSGNGTITATYTQNTTGTSRSASITVTVTGLTPIVVTVTQAVPTLAVTPANQVVPAASGTTSFAVTSNSVWTASSNQAWCTVNALGTGNGTVTATYTANSTALSRVANITITVSGLSAIVVTVTQDTPTLSVTPSNQNVSSLSGTTSFSVTSNSAWAVSSDQSWCTVPASGTGNGSITASYTQNLLVTQRVATLTITVDGITPVSVTVTQAAISPTLTVSPSNQAVTSNSGTALFSVTSNVNWTVSSDQAWCTVTASGSGNGTLIANYTQNMSGSRVATITVTASGVATVTVTVTQDAAPVVEFYYTTDNIVQTSDKIFEFDLLLLDNDATLPFELATVQAGVLFNSTIYNGGTVSASIVPGTSTLNTSQQPTSVQFTQSANILKLASKAPPGAGNGTIISTNPLSPSHVCRIKMTNTVAWATSSSPDMVFNFLTIPYPTKLSQYLNGINTACVVNSTNCIINSAIVLNPPPQITVTPANQTVTASAGSTSFTVASNAGWTAISDQSWCTLAPSTGFGIGLIMATCTANTTSVERVANITISVTGLPATIVTVTQNGIVSKTLNMSLFLEGLYDGSALMHPAMDESGVHWGATIADKVTLELRDAANYTTLVYTASNVDLHTDGNISITIPSSYSGNYYLTVRHRNSIETVSANPVSFSGYAIIYNFDDATKAYGGNLLHKPDGRWVIYAGDVNQDGIVDSGDMIPVDNDAANFVTGYLSTDVNGDGLIDSGDMILLDNNSASFVSANKP